MKKFVIENCMKIISQNKNYDKTKLAEIKYGLEGLYLTLSKLIIITTIAIILGIIKEYIIFLLIYNIIRIPSFGLHATKSWICLVSSTIIFIGIPLLINIITLNKITKIKRRKIYKILSTTISIIYMVLSIKINNKYISNCFTFSILLQNILISPITYKIFKLPYNNYKTYVKTHGLNE